MFVLGCAGDFWKKTATTTFEKCVDHLVKLAQSKAVPADALGKMMHELDAYLVSFPDPNVRFYERCKVRIAFANKARSDEVVIQFLRKLDE